MQAKPKAQPCKPHLLAQILTVPSQVQLTSHGGFSSRWQSGVAQPANACVAASSSADVMAISLAIVLPQVAQALQRYISSPMTHKVPLQWRPDLAACEQRSNMHA